MIQGNINTEAIIVILSFDLSRNCHTFIRLHSMFSPVVGSVNPSIQLFSDCWKFSIFTGSTDRSIFRPF